MDKNIIFKLSNNDNAKLNCTITYDKIFFISILLHDHNFYKQIQHTTHHNKPSYSPFHVSCKKDTLFQYASGF